MFESLCMTDLINFEGTSTPIANIAQKALDVSNTRYLVLEIILLALLIFFSTFKTERKNLNFPKCKLPASAIFLSAQGFLG